MRRIGDSTGGDDYRTVRVSDPIDGPDASTEDADRRVWKSWIRRTGNEDATCRTIMLFGFAMTILAAMIIGIALLIERNAFLSTHVVEGIQGIPGKCNLTQNNQTFFISGTTELEGNVFVGGDFTVDDALTVFYNSTEQCVEFFSYYPLCFDVACIESDCFGSRTPGGNATFNSSVTFLEPSFFFDYLFVNETLTIGGATFYWDGTNLSFLGNFSFPTNFSVPLNLGTAGNISQNGPCIAINASSCIQAFGNVTFYDYVLGPFDVQGNASVSDCEFFFDPFHSVCYVSSALVVSSSASDPLNLTSGIVVNVVAPDAYFSGNVTVAGSVENQLKLANGERFECDPGPVFAYANFTPGCSCLKIESQTGICLKSDGTQGITASGSGNFTFSSMNVSFAGGASVVSPLSVMGVATFKDDVVIEKNLTVNGDMFFNDLTVSGNATFTGPITSTSTNANFVSVNSTISRWKFGYSTNLTTFYGQGAVFDTGTTLLVNGKMWMSTSPSDLRCTSPIFYPNTPSTPNANPCVQECTDMQRCDVTMSKLNVLTNFTVGLSTNTSYVGDVKLGRISGRQLSSVEINSASVTINASVPVKVMNDLNVLGDILQGASAHPCCSGAQSDVSNKLLVVEMNVVTASLSTSEVSVVPFDLVQNPASTLSSSFNTVSYTFTAAEARMLAITVYLVMDPSQYNLGTFRGVTLKKSFSYPTSGPQSVRTCSQFTNFTSLPSLLQVTCTYSGYFGVGDTLQVAPYYDFVGSITLYGASSPSPRPTTRLEIYQM